MPRSRRIGNTSTIRTRLFSDVLIDNGNRFTLSNFPRRTVGIPTSEGRKPIIEKEGKYYFFKFINNVVFFINLNISKTYSYSFK